MDLGLTEAQQMLRNSAREFLEAECPEAFVRAMEEDERGYTPESWQKIAENGWLGLIFPEEHGGTGLEFLDLCVLLEETGRAMLPGPFFSTVVLGGMTILDAGSVDQKRQYLPGIAEGQAIATLALTEPNVRWDAAGVRTTAEPDGEGFVINGTKLFVPNANVSDYLVVAARTGDADEDVSLFILPANTPGVSQTLLKTIASDRQSEVTFDGAHVPRSALLGELNGGWPTIARVIQWGAVGKCAEMVGNGQKVLDMTVDFVKQRIQFGRPIGSFQAIQHHCANMAHRRRGVALHHQPGRMAAVGGAARRQRGCHGQGVGERRRSSRVRHRAPVPWRNRLHQRAQHAALLAPRESRRAGIRRLQGALGGRGRGDWAVGPSARPARS